MRQISGKILQAVVAAGAAALLVGCAGPQAAPVTQTPGCLSDAQVDAMMAAFTARQTAANPPQSMTMADAACTRAKLQQRLSKSEGELVGFKAGLTNPAAQQKFNTDQPVWGALYSAMLLPDGSAVDADFGAKPLFEADMLVRVKSAAVNDAQTPAEVLAQIDQIVPFIELPDLVIEDPSRFNGAVLSAINVAARLGVTGEPMAVPTDAAGQARLLEQLRNMQVRMVDASGQELGGGTGSDVLGHPLNAVSWMAAALREQGMSMRAGQLISVGSFSATMKPQAGQEITVHYDGVDGLAPVSVRFR